MTERTGTYYNDEKTARFTAIWDQVPPFQGNVDIKFKDYLFDVAKATDAQLITSKTRNALFLSPAGVTGQFWRIDTAQDPLSGRINTALHTGVFFETNKGNRYLIISVNQDHPMVSRDDRTSFVAQHGLWANLRRYGLKTIYASYDHRRPYRADHSIVDLPSVEYYLSHYEWDDFSKKAARQRDWSVFQFLRFRATPWEVPEE